MSRTGAGTGGGRATFQVPADPGTALPQSGNETGGELSFRAFGVDGFRVTLKNVLGYEEADVKMACDILMESAPLIVARGVVTLDDDFVSRPALSRSRANPPSPKNSCLHVSSP